MGWESTPVSRETTEVGYQVLYTCTSQCYHQPNCGAINGGDRPVGLARLPLEAGRCHPQMPSPAGLGQVGGGLCVGNECISRDDRSPIRESPRVSGRRKQTDGKQTNVRAGQDCGGSPQEGGKGQTGLERTSRDERDDEARSGRR